MSETLSPREKYLQERHAMIAEDRARSLDSNVVLSETEERVNAEVKKLRDGVIADTLRGLNPVRRFVENRHFIESSKLFGFLAKMPKGAALHIHSESAGSFEWIVDEAARHDDCFVCWTDDAEDHIRGTLVFLDPEEVPEGYLRVSTLLNRDEGAREALRSLLTLRKVADGVALGHALERIIPFTSHLRVFQPYYLAAFQLLVEDGVQYVEMRTSLHPLIDPERSAPLEGMEVLEAFKALRAQVQEALPGFDFRLILSERRNGASPRLWAGCERALELKTRFPDLIAGYELIGEEDEGPTTFEFINDFVGFSQRCKARGVDLPFIFFDGESVWPRDLNLYDAVLLGARRVAFGRSLFHSPAVESRLRERGVAIESALVSDLMLGYSHDLRVHQSVGYMRRGLPVVLSSDDPAILGDNALSYSFWLACVAWMLDLRGLKQLSLDSLKASLLPEEAKREAIEAWRGRWDAFVQEMVHAL